MPSAKPQLTIHLDPGLLEQVVDYADQHGLSKNGAVNRLLRQALATTRTTATEGN